MAEMNTNALIASSLTTGAQGAATFAGADAQASALREQARYESSQLKFQAGLADRRAGEAIRQGDFAASRALREGRQLQGAQRATAAAQNVAVGSGNAAQLQYEAARDAAEDAAMIRNNALLEAWGHQVEASGMRSQAKMGKIAAKNRSAQTMMAAGAQFGRDLTAGYDSYRRLSDYELELAKRKAGSK